MEKCVVFWMLHHLMGFLHLIGVLLNVDANLAGFGSAAYTALHAGRFYADFRAHFSMPCALSQIAS
ncbi:hypothetical protein OKW49_000230 [Paraburkholderia youngii]|uniref:hypothetical protein n=1 Tax=Paraburkholderia youngii TaxID=2782701 RepID=UPI003D1BCA93